ncbi:hypothetical protein MGYG_07907 [Nannizzia gypsea CBS 118893]|uniref:Protein kinase domain-containing protein n=1 Tax=Arthroderma gypseum (strain ATCC MYA-4604 / CBS 118893) TaxID=535722 RepID=E4V4I1_ARTGP|nr:hypothetical protein MGYG_07907 [Nannizzia gypsea CBS 118893]EFR04905.1 hypothetical protein MGYG_07907 [Nannizzia gypsea CBS 118893]
MSASELETLRQELEKARRLQQDAEKAKENAERREEDAKLELEKAQKQTQPTSLPEFLDACHVHLSVGFSSRVNHKTGTQGLPENASSKLRPNYIREWTTFPQEQLTVWQDLLNVDFASEPHFTSLHTLKEIGKDMQVRLMGSEMDLCFYERYTVEDRVSLVIRTLHMNSQLRDKFNILGKVIFENHGNTIDSAERSPGPSNSTPQQSPVQKRRRQVDEHGDDIPAMPTVWSTSSRPRADQFCVYNAGSEGNIPVFIIEYKAPHKLTLDTIEKGLGDIDVNEVICVAEDDSITKIIRRRVAAVVTQAFSYMIQGELEFGYICTGEAFIFLRVAADDPTTVYYYLSIPNNDIKDTTGWNIDPGNNKLHLTAVGQVLAFTLRALKSRPHGQVWRKNAEAQLKRWEIEDDSRLFSPDIPELEKIKGRKLSEYKPTHRSRDEYIRLTPVKTRSRKLFSASCRDPEASSGSSDDDNGGGGFPPSSPTAMLPRRSSNVMVVIPQPSSRDPPPPPPTGRKQYTYNTGPIAPWCTQKCLLGLRNRGPLDPDCPNVASHGNGHHVIDDRECRELIREQIIGKAGPWGCESMHRHGTSAALFWVTTFPYSYTLVAKAVPIEMVNRAIYEERIYKHLSSIQGVNIPVCLGAVDISPSPLWYDGICAVVRLLLLGHAGRVIKLHAGLDKLKEFLPSVLESLQAIHGHQVLHRDTHINNMFWNAENKRVILIDFERARIIDTKSPGKTSLKRKREETTSYAKGKNIDLFKMELHAVKGVMA